MSKWFNVILVFLIFTACSKHLASENSGPYIDSSKFSTDSTLLGTEWEWQKTVCCMRNPGVTTPDSTGNTHSLVIKKDSTTVWYKNGNIERKESLDAILNNTIWGVKGDSLIISRAHVDGAQRLYIRK